MAKSNNDINQIVARRVFTGMNSKDYGGIIGDSEIAVAKGIDFSSVGTLRGILGFADAANDNGDYRVLGLKRYKKDGGGDWLVMAENTNIRHWAGSGNWSDADKNDFTANLDMAMIVGGGRLWLSNGTDNVFSWDQTTFTDLGAPATTTNPPAFTGGVFANNRLHVFKGTFYYYSAVLLADATAHGFDQSSQVIGIEPLNGDNIVGVVDFGNNELLFLKESSLHIIDISNANPLYWSKTYSFTDNGCIGKRAFVRVGNDVFYLSRQARGITSVGKNQYNNTVGLTVAVSDQIYKNYLDNINWAYAHLSVAAHYDNKIIFVVPTGTSTTPNTAFIYFLHQDGNINGWGIKENVPANSFEIYNGNLYFGDTDEARIYRLFSGYVDGATAITRTFESRIEDFSGSGAMYQKKVGVLIKIDFLSGDDNGSVDVYFKIDNGDYRFLGSIDTGQTSVALPASLPFEFDNRGVISKEFRDIDLEDSWSSCQIKIEQTESGKTFELLGYMIMARIQNIDY